MQEEAFAKINLALHVRGREANGYHRIETLFAFAETGDRLRVEESDALSLRTEGPFAAALPPSDDNLVLRAAAELRSRHGIEAGAALILEKQLPVASGLGGGSADAAAALRLLARWWGLEYDPPSMVVLARELGADVPACLVSRPLRGTGRGDRLEPVEDRTIAGTPLLLVNPGKPLSTADVFARWDGVDRGVLMLGDPLDAALGGRNDLEAAARALMPEVSEVLDRLTRCDGTKLVRMSGSGASCFALFASESERDAAQVLIAAEQPHWWLSATRIRD
jgi:4-diphosphocytidyl-2-C-methyl-D-erythritol kinase